MSRNGIEGFSMLSAFSYFKYLFCHKWSLVILFAYQHCTMFPLIKNILLPRIPSKIFRAIVCSYTIIVTCLHSTWTWPKKCLQNQTVNTMLIGLIPYVQNNLFVSIVVKNPFEISGDCRKLISLSTDSKCSDITEIAYLINSIVSINVFPNFFFHFRLLKQKALCGWQLLSRRLPCTRLLSSLYHTQLATV